MHIFFFPAKNTVTKTQAIDCLFPGYELTDTFQDQHISNLCFLISFCAHLCAEKKVALGGTMHLEKKDVVAVVVVVVPSLAQDLRVPCCPGCRQSGDGRAKEGTGDCSAGDRVAGPSMTAWQHPQLEETKPPSALTRTEGVQRSQAGSAQSRAQRSDGELQIKP